MHEKVSSFKKHSQKPNSGTIDAKRCQNLSLDFSFDIVSKEDAPAIKKRKRKEFVDEVLSIKKFDVFLLATWSER